MKRVRSGAYALLCVSSKDSGVTALPFSDVLYVTGDLLYRYSGGAVLPHSTALFL
jgi:hypothetical protein